MAGWRKFATVLLGASTVGLLPGCAPDTPTGPNPPAPIQVATTTTHSCATLDDGTVRCWGNNRNGQLGNNQASGVNTDSSTAVEVVGLTDATQVAVGDFFSCALRSTGAVSCWGLGSHGRLGTGSTASTSVPLPVVGITDAVAIGLNNGSAFPGGCAVHATGSISCWGSNSEGVLGTASVPRTGANSSTVPVTVDGITDALELSVGFSNACARRAGGTVSCWGRNTSGIIGDPSLPTGGSVYYLSPVAVVGLAGATSISVGNGRACAMTAAGARCWGGGTASPSPVPGDPGYTTVMATSGGCGLKAGAESCWGANNFNQLGSTAWPCCMGLLTPVATTPQPVTGLSSPVASIGSGYATSCAVTTDASVWCWGYDLWGALGTGTNTQGLDANGMPFEPGRGPFLVVGV